MAGTGATSVLDIDVNSKEFDDFVKEWKQFQASLSKLPNDYKALNAQLSSFFASGTNGVKGMAAQTKKQTQETKLLNQAWKGVAATTKSVAGTIKSIGGMMTQLLPGLGMLGLGAGLPAAMFAGFAALQNSASNDRRANFGAGVSNGQREATNIVYGRAFGITASQLSHIADMKSTPGMFGALGMSTGIFDANRLRGMSNTDILQSQIQHIRDLNNTSPLMAQNAAKAAGFDMEQFRNIVGRTDEELKQLTDQFEQTRKATEANDEAQRRAASFMIKLEEFGTKIKNILVDKLEPLSEPLGKLLETVGDAIGGVLGSENFKNGIKWFGDEITALGEYLKSDGVKSDLKDLMEDLKAFWQVLKSMIDWGQEHFPSIFGKKKDETNTKAAQNEAKGEALAGAALGAKLGSTLGISAGPVGMLVGGAAGALVGAGAGFVHGRFYSKYALDAQKEHGQAPLMAQTGDEAMAQSFPEAGFPPPSSISYGGNALEAQRQASLRKAGISESDLNAREQANGIPIGLMKNILNQESKGDINAVSPTGARGLFQSTGAARKDFYSGNDSTKEAQLAGATKQLAAYARMFGGDPEAIAAAYNAGPGSVQIAKRAYGKDWKDHLGDALHSVAPSVNAAAKNREARDYVNITVHNATGSNVTAQLAAVPVLH
ncbi:lytic transglycosylase domain-containing protein [Paraburkholderia caribensis]|uniref:lytic transglycosylase domain-containing protein n=1 Tax=Paraburkholderia caribensis TaxID=75105 RepID=UPI0020913ACF|nr:lytic transglycosylase domain-containing protein [Paraburkholderia caribensis]MCO4880235.1 lytic transglycosylase domain-containing protein [Paraburkholderia caribensis]